MINNESDTAKAASSSSGKSVNVEPASNTVLTAIFHDRATADAAYQLLLNRHYERGEVNLVMSEETHQRYLIDEVGEVEINSDRKMAEGAGIGGALGTAIGAVTAVAILGGSIAVPGWGYVLAGPLISAFTGAGMGGVAGGLIGALIGWGVPEERVTKFENDLRQGGTLLGVTPKNEENKKFITHQWKRAQAEFTYM